MIDPKLIQKERDVFLWTRWQLHLTIPSVLAVGEPFALRMTALGPDGLPDGEFGRDIALSANGPVEGLPDRIRFDPADGGHAAVEGLRPVGEGCIDIAAHTEGAPNPVFSNPAWVIAAPPWRVYWGDLHIHTYYSNCLQWSCKDPEFGYAFAREVAHLDFAAAADHLRGIASNGARWPRLQKLARQYDAPGSFVPFLAFESSHKAGYGGDNNAYFLGTDAPYFWLDRDDMRGIAPEVTLRQLWDFLDRTGEAYFTAPHHSCRAQKYRRFTNEYEAAREPLFEIYSAWGSSECRWNRFPLAMGNTDEPAYFVDALRAGCRYGVIASSDGHCTLPGGESRNWGAALWPQPLCGYHHNGLAAVRAKELTREALWKGLTSRNTWATTFPRTLLDVSIGDIEMGEAAHVGRQDPLRKRREIKVRASIHGGGPAGVTLMRNGEPLGTQPIPPRARDHAVEFTDESPLDTIAIRGAEFHPEPFAVYYVRIETRTDSTQWSSPLWLEL